MHSGEAEGFCLVHRLATIAWSSPTNPGMFEEGDFLDTILFWRWDFSTINLTIFREGSGFLREVYGHLTRWFLQPPPPVFLGNPKKDVGGPRPRQHFVCHLVEPGGSFASRTGSCCGESNKNKTSNHIIVERMRAWRLTNAHRSVS